MRELSLAGGHTAEPLPVPNCAGSYSSLEASVSPNPGPSWPLVSQITKLRVADVEGCVQGLLAILPRPKAMTRLWGMPSPGRELGGQADGVGEGRHSTGLPLWGSVLSLTLEVGPQKGL